MGTVGTLPGPYAPVAQELDTYAAPTDDQISKDLCRAVETKAYPLLGSVLLAEAARKPHVLLPAINKSVQLTRLESLRQLLIHAVDHKIDLCCAEPIFLAIDMQHLEIILLFFEYYALSHQPFSSDLLVACLKRIWDAPSTSSKKQLLGVFLAFGQKQKIPVPFDLQEKIHDYLVFGISTEDQLSKELCFAAENEDYDYSQLDRLLHTQAAQKADVLLPAIKKSVQSNETGSLRLLLAHARDQKIALNCAEPIFLALDLFHLDILREFLTYYKTSNQKFSQVLLVSCLRRTCSVKSSQTPAEKAILELLLAFGKEQQIPLPPEFEQKINAYLATFP